MSALHSLGISPYTAVGVYNDLAFLSLLQPCYFGGRLVFLAILESFKLSLGRHFPST